MIVMAEEKTKKTETKQKKIKTERKVKPEEKTEKVVVKEVPVSKKKEKKVYRVTGSFLMGNRHQTFTKEVMASDPREKIYSDFGSRHNVKRRNIKIEDVKELKNDEITDRLLKQMVKMVGV